MFAPEFMIMTHSYYQTTMSNLGIVWESHSNVAGWHTSHKGLINFEGRQDKYMLKTY